MNTLAIIKPTEQHQKKMFLKHMSLDLYPPPKCKFKISKCFNCKIIVFAFAVPFQIIKKLFVIKNETGTKGIVQLHNYMITVQGSLGS